MIEVQKAASARVFAEVYNERRLEAVESLFHPRYVQKPIGYSGHAGVQRHAEELQTAFPDLRFELVDQIAEADGVVNLVLMTGTHSGPLWRHIPPTGREVAVMTIVVHRFEQGLIVEGIVLADQLGMLQTLGVVPTPVWAAYE
jgi:predicted ester cyclase